MRGRRAAIAMLRHLTAMLVLCAATVEARQATAPVSAAGCAAILNDATRLACYDRLFGHPRPAAGTGPAAVNAVQGAVTAAPAGPAAPVTTTLGAMPRLRIKAPVLPPRHDANVVAADLQSAPAHSPLDQRWELDPQSKLGTFVLRAYKPVYALPLLWTDRVNQMPGTPAPDHQVGKPLGLQRSESMFQLSLKTKLWQNLFGDNGDLWFGYTQDSHWQVYNGALSRPFRETDYEPEAILVFRTDDHALGWSGRLLSVSLTHQSNGRDLPLSRSWNRVILTTGFERDGWILLLRPWWRIPESRRVDDNPGIQNYMGRGELLLVRNLGRQEFSLLLRHSLRLGNEAHGAAQLDWAFPLSGNLRGHLQVFDGYGESLVDYNHRAIYVGLGISLVEWY